RTASRGRWGEEHLAIALLDAGKCVALLFQADEEDDVVVRAGQADGVGHAGDPVFEEGRQQFVHAQLPGGGGGVWSEHGCSLVVSVRDGLCIAQAGAAVKSAVTVTGGPAPSPSDAAAGGA